MFYATTGYEPYEELVDLFFYVGIQRTAEILCCYKQSQHIRNPLAWFKRAVHDGYKPSDVAIKKNKKTSRIASTPTNRVSDVPFYNWLEE